MVSQDFFTTWENNQVITLVCLSLACFRIYLEIIGFDFSRLPLTRGLIKLRSNEGVMKFHKTGLYISIGYIILFAPGILLS